MAEQLLGQDKQDNEPSLELIGLLLADGDAIMISCA